MYKLITIDELVKGPSGNIPCGRFGFSELDNMVDAIQKHQLIILGGRTGMGKTTVLIHLIAANLIDGKRILFASFEKPNHRINDRFLSIYKNLFYSSNMQSNTIRDDDNLIKMLNNQLFFVENTGHDFLKFSQFIKPLLSENKVDLVFIDGYQHLNNHDISNRKKDQSSYMMNVYRNWSNQYGQSIIITSQLSREVEHRYGDKRPQLSDLKGSSDIEELADLVIMLHRSEYYGFTEDYLGNSTANMLDLLVLKNNNGKLGELHLRYNPEHHILEDFC
jgi:replicative DNA helicase